MFTSKRSKKKSSQYDSHLNPKTNMKMISLFRFTLRSIIEFYEQTNKQANKKKRKVKRSNEMATIIYSRNTFTFH